MHLDQNGTAQHSTGMHYIALNLDLRTLKSPKLFYLPYTSQQYGHHQDTV